VKQEPVRMTPAQDLAINGGPKAVDRLDGQRVGKIGAEEFMELARLWGFSATTEQRIRAAVLDDDRCRGPWLMRYHQAGPSVVDALEARARELLGAPYVLAVHSGTSALEAGLAACGVGPGMEVIVPGFTFIATAAAVVHSRAVPVICEIGPSLTIDPQDLERKITSRTRAVIPVHVMGRPADMAAIARVATRHGIAVVEDVAQAAGGSFRGRRLGTFGDVGCFSLNSHKIIGAGEAGLLVTASAALYARALSYHDNAAAGRPGYPGPRSGENLICGTNVRMSELEGAVNLGQLAKMDGLIAGYRRNKGRVVGRLTVPEGVSVHASSDIAGEIGSQLPFFLPSSGDCVTVVDALAAEGVPARRYGADDDDHVYIGWHAVLQQRSASAFGCPWHCPAVSHDQAVTRAEAICPRTVDLIGRLAVVDISPWWTARDCTRISRAMAKVLAAFYPAGGQLWQH
jgi:8-amino-3,8-dideoxy-alpha-D-manno-octulosonate transaminase